MHQLITQWLCTYLLRIRMFTLKHDVHQLITQWLCIYLLCIRVFTLKHDAHELITQWLCTYLLRINFEFTLGKRLVRVQDQDQDSLLVKRRNDNH